MANQQETKALMPPYVAFATFKTMLAGFKEHVLPSRIDRSVLGNFSGIVGGQLITTLKFLGLISEDGKPMQSLAMLVGTLNTEQWADQLGDILKHAYAPVFSINLQTASPSLFNEHFAKVYQGEGSTLRKSMTFFLTAIQESKLPISPYILKNKKPRSGPTKKRTQRQQNGGNAGDRFTPPPPLHLSQKLSEQVLAILDKKDLKPEVEKAVYVLLKYLREEGK